MILNIARAAGIPALVHPQNDPTLYMSCSFALRCCKPNKQATFSLQFSFPLPSSDSEAIFTVFIDADNLVPGTNTIKPATSRIPNNVLDLVAQGGSPDYRTLSLTTTEDCPIWCTGCPESTFWQDSNDSFDRFLMLVALSEIQIVFDHKWIPAQNHTLLQEIIHHPEKLNGIPVDERRNRYGRRYMRTERQVRSTVESGEFELPPYSVRSSIKRHRQSSSSSVSPSPKRALHSYAPDGSPTQKASIASVPSLDARTPPVVYESAIQDPGSPTEKATTASTPSPKAAFSPVARVSTSQRAVTDILGTILEDIFDNLPTVPPSSPSSPISHKRSSNDTIVNPYPHSLSRSYFALRALLSTRSVSRAEAHLEEIYNSAVLHATDTRTWAEAEFSEYVQDLRLELAGEKDEGIVEVNEVVDAGLAKMSKGIEALETAFAQIERRLDDFQPERAGTSKVEGAHRAEGEGDEWKREMRKRETQMREREMEACERERDIAQRERDVSKRERDAGKWERELCKKEIDLDRRER